MDTRENNRLQDEMMRDRFNRWYDKNKGREDEFDAEVQAGTTDYDKIIAQSFKHLHFYTENEKKLKAYIAFENDESSTKDAAIIIGGYLKISSDLNQGKNESVDAYLNALTQNEDRDRRSYTIKRLLEEYNPEFRLECTLKRSA